MTEETGRLVREHLAAFNAHDTDRLLAGMATDVVWRTGRDTFHGRDLLADVFDAWLWAMSPALEVRSLLTGPGTAAVELTERLTVEGEEHSFAIAVFFRVADGLIAEAVVYREGNADLTDPPSPDTPGS